MAETGLVHIMAAHSSFSAILAEEAGLTDCGRRALSYLRLMGCRT